MKRKLIKPSFRTVIDLGLRPIEQRNDPKRLAIDELKGLGLIFIMVIGLVVVACIAIVTLGRTAGFIVLLVTFAASFLAILRQFAQRRSSIVIRVRPDGTNQAIRLFIGLPIVTGLFALLTREPVYVGFTLVLVLVAVVAWRRRDLAPAGLREIHALLAPDETTLGDGFAADKSRKWHRDCWKILVATDRRLLISTFGAKHDKINIVQVALPQIAGYGLKWGVLGTQGELTLHFKSPFNAADPRTSIEYYKIAPTSLVSLVEALRSHGVPGPAIEHPPGDGKDPPRPPGAPSFVKPGAFGVAGHEVDVIDEAGHKAPRTTREKVAMAVLVVLLTAIFAFVGLLVAGVDMRSAKVMVDQYTKHRLPTDGRSDLTGQGAAIAYPAADDLIELETDEHWGEGPHDGARWELRTTFTKGYNVISLANYVFVPTLDDKQAIERFVKSKDSRHRELAGKEVTHETVTVDGRTGHAWNHDGKDGYWYYAAWFPQPTGTVRLECIAKNQRARFEEMCAEALKSLRFGT